MILPGRAYASQYYASRRRNAPSTGFSIALVPQIVLILTIPLLGRLADRTGRKTMMLAGTCALIVLALPSFYCPTTDGTDWKLASLLMLNLCLAAMPACVYSQVPSLFGTGVRFTGMAVSYNVSVALFAGTAPMLNSWPIQVTGSRMVPACYLIAAAVVGTVALPTRPDRTGRPMRGDGPRDDA